MVTERPVVLQVDFHCEGGATAASNIWFYTNLVLTGAVPSQLSLQQGQKIGVQGLEAVDLTVGDNFLHFYARLRQST